VVSGATCGRVTRGASVELGTNTVCSGGHQQRQGAPPARCQLRLRKWG
jgi:hypothetical protein